VTAWLTFRYRRKEVAQKRVVREAENRLRFRWLRIIFNAPNV